MKSLKLSVKIHHQQKTNSRKQKIIFVMWFIFCGYFMLLTRHQAIDLIKCTHCPHTLRKKSSSNSVLTIVWYITVFWRLVNRKKAEKKNIFDGEKCETRKCLNYYWATKKSSFLHKKNVINFNMLTPAQI